MLDRMSVGELPKKHHIALRGDSGELRHEECITRRGFDGPYTIVYHLRRPHTARALEMSPGFPIAEAVGERPLRKRHYLSQKVDAPGSFLEARRPLLFNRDVVFSVSKPTSEDGAYFPNGDGDDLHFVFEGSGTLRTIFGDLRYEKFDYVYVPRGTIHRFIPDPGTKHYLATIECLGGMGLLGQWRNSEQVIIREASRLVIILYAPSNDAETRIEDVRAAYKAAFQQESVLRIDSASCVSF